MAILKRLAAVGETLLCAIPARPPARRFALPLWFAYLVGVILVAASHESWFDEAQAWLMARELTPAELLVSYIRYEGTPPLWHLLLMLPAKAGMPFDYLQLISACTAAAGIGLLIHRAPFPPVFKLLLPFGFFLFYQYAVIARSYCLVWPVLAALAALHARRREHPRRYFLLLVLLASISMHTALLSGGLVLVELIQTCQTWPLLTRPERKTRLGYFVGFGLFTLLIVAINLPPPDLTFGPTTPPDIGRFLTLNRQMLAESLTGEFCTSALLLAAITWWACKGGQVAALLIPLGLLSLLFGLRYANLWHSGIVYCWLLFILWLASQNQKRWPMWFALSLTTLAALQITWSIKTVRFDLDHAYSGAGAAARSIAPLLRPDTTVSAHGFASHGVLPYFLPGTIRFQNAQPPRHDFYLWSPAAIPTTAPAVLAENEDILLVTRYTIGDKTTPIPAHYRLISAHPGATFWKTAIYEEITYYIYARIPSGQDTSPLHGLAPSHTP